MDRKVKHIRFVCRHRACSFIGTFTRDDCPSSCPECGGRNYTKQYNYENRGELADNPRWSASMGCSKEEIPVFQKLYPGSKYHPETGDLLIKNRSHKIREMKRRGFDEF